MPPGRRYTMRRYPMMTEAMLAFTRIASAKGIPQLLSGDKHEMRRASLKHASQNSVIPFFASINGPVARVQTIARVRRSPISSEE